MPRESGTRKVRRRMPALDIAETAGPSGWGCRRCSRWHDTSCSSSLQAFCRFVQMLHSRPSNRQPRRDAVVHPWRPKASDRTGALDENRQSPAGFSPFGLVCIAPVVECKGIERIDGYCRCIVRDRAIEVALNPVCKAAIVQHPPALAIETKHSAEIGKGLVWVAADTFARARARPNIPPSEDQAAPRQPNPRRRPDCRRVKGVPVRERHILQRRRAAT